MTGIAGAFRHRTVSIELTQTYGIRLCQVIPYAAKAKLWVKKDAAEQNETRDFVIDR
jgi:hypothetical protein